MRVAFDLDDTLIPVGRRFRTEPPSSALLAWAAPERLRCGAGRLLRELRAEGHEIWVYTTSLRPAWMIRLLFGAYGVALGGVVNQAIHLAWEGRQSAAAPMPSKYPPAFGIDVLVDDSTGVALEGEKHGFRVITIAPFEDHWVDIVRDALRRDIRG